MSAPRVSVATVSAIAPEAGFANPPFEFSWFRSIDDIDRHAWEQCFGDDNVMQSHAFQKATECAQLANVVFHYLTVAQGAKTIAIFPCFEFKISLTVVASPQVNKIVSGIRRIFPDFLYLRAFIAGTPAAICQDLFGISSGIDRETADTVLSAACDAAITRADALGAGLVIVKEITSKLLPQVGEVLRKRFTLAESPATTYLYVGESGAGSYRERLRKKYRSVMTGRLRKFTEAGLRWETHHDFAGYARAMHPLYLQVLHHSKIRFEELTPEFFAQVSERLGDSSFALLCFDGDRLVAFELFLRDRRWTHPIYLGMDYSYRDKGSLYFNCIYKIIDTVERDGKAVVQLGQTSYDAKSAIGAVVHRLYVGVHHRNRVLNYLISRFRNVLFPPTRIPRQQRVFRDIAANSQALHRHQIVFEEGE